MGGDAACTLYRQALENLETVKQRLEQGEPVRVWYSRQPDDLCGLYWFAAQLSRWAVPAGQVWAVKLPEWVQQGGTVVEYTGWGEVEPGAWGRLVPLQARLPKALVEGIAARWQQLQQENAPLRAVVNGRLCSVPEDFYDPFLLRELDKLTDEFLEAEWIGRVLGRYQLGISDGWLALRVEEMIRQGMLVPLSQPPQDRPSYHRMLKKQHPGL